MITKRRYSRKSVFMYVLAIFAVLVVNSPIIYMAIVSFMPAMDIISVPPKWIFNAHINHYISVLSGGTPQVRFEFFTYTLNSIVVSLGATILSLVVSFPAAYSMARWRTGGENFRNYILSLYLLPPAIFIPPVYVLFQTYGLIDTHLGLIIAYCVFNAPFCILVLESFIRDMPIEIEEAAWIDGCSKLGTMARITIPLAVPGIIAVAVLTFIASWNEYMLTLTLTRVQAVTVTLGISKFVTGYAVLWGEIFAASILSIIPLLIFFLLVQRYLVAGLTLGAIKR
jgi:ABC-type glycerol-3-phosphate transport system permease component